MSAFNRFEPCALYLSPAHAAPSAIRVPILRFSTLDEGLMHFKLKIKPEAWHFYRLVTESGATLDAAEIASYIDPDEA
ncbi:MAG: hypothetical protein AB1508_05970 [Pseudomonadota bacterium]